ncbi:DUF2163 domain-containing protein [Novosphingobium album (ex Liu et al. 2023)]|uniref:DUF2163 domain-containing protein n=1 Tax=Novosphingobium album (ex Liu et al. 2023) TaxID=3031130 RepID=A0ABT5WL86_9SPHN|nr:DUF2163 domain-containing protein [Novosphingobium album (ex Liu et al. 2023)]MDE8650814.1 DUF2163 domain-containing protein [Novosphingobium album (ex Liu et al. 2023)]
MTRAWFSGDLETIATFWQLLRRDGFAFGFTAHDRDLWFDGILHRASPGMIPSALRKSGDFEPDSADVRGALSHDAIRARDLADGRFDGARVRIGVIDWESGEREVLYRGAIGGVTEEDGHFAAELVSRKADLLRDPVPRTSPACRAAFCGPGCTRNPAFHTREAQALALDTATNAIAITAGLAPADHVGGMVVWLDGPQAGKRMQAVALNEAGKLVLDTPIDPATPPGTPILIREGCDHTLDTCATRFGNAVNFQGEPFLPGNDLLTRYPSPPA